VVVLISMTVFNSWCSIMKACKCTRVHAQLMHPMHISLSQPSYTFLVGGATIAKIVDKVLY